MENALLIGLSRQIALQRELDVVANNIANINTTGFKADGAVFEEYLMPVARADQLPAAPTGAELRAGPRAPGTISARARSSRPATRSTSRSTATPSSWCRRRAASATPATARCRSTRSGQLVTSDGDRGARRQRADPVPDRPTATSRSIPTARSRCARAPTPPIRRAASCGSCASTQPQQLQKDGADLFARPPASRRSRAGTDVARRCRARSSKSNVRARHRDDAHDRGHAHLHADRQPCCSSQATCAAAPIDKLAEVPA